MTLWPTGPVTAFSFQMLTLIDESTRECWVIDVARKLKSGDALASLFIDKFGILLFGFPFFFALF